MNDYCAKCMMPLDGETKCHYCGYEPTNTAEEATHVLRPGTILHERYLLGLPLGQGGFGITYIGRDLLLDMRVAIKEYYPSGYANRYIEKSDRITATGIEQKEVIDKGKARFLQEAKALAQFHGTSGVVDVRDYFEENDTAYIVMEYLEGNNLRVCLKNRLFSVDEIFSLMDPVFCALKTIHETGVIHRDISPDNIMMQKDGSLKLMDFGAARLTNINDQRSVSVVLKSGYAPEEQYRPKGIQGPWTDIYALCATIYKCITGITPDDAMERVYDDQIKWPSELGIAITASKEAVLRKGLAVRAADRYQSLTEFLDDLHQEVNPFTMGADVTVPFSVGSGGEESAADDMTVLDSSEDIPTIYDPITKEKDSEETSTEGDAAQAGIEGEDGKKTKKSAKRVIFVLFALLIGIGVITVAMFSHNTHDNASGQEESPKTETPVLLDAPAFYGKHWIESVGYERETQTIYFTRSFDGPYQTISVGGEEYEISLFPVFVSGSPADAGSDSSKGEMTCVYVDRFGEGYTVEGRFYAKEGKFWFYPEVFQGKSVVVQPTRFIYDASFRHIDGIVLSSSGEEAEFKDDFSMSGSIISGKLSQGSEAYENIISVEYAEETAEGDEASSACIRFDDGGVAENVSTTAYHTLSNINFTWNSVSRPYNGRTEEFNERGSADSDVISCYPYGFVLIADSKAYYYTSDVPARITDGEEFLQRVKGTWLEEEEEEYITFWNRYDGSAGPYDTAFTIHVEDGTDYSGYVSECTVNTESMEVEMTLSIESGPDEYDTDGFSFETMWTINYRELETSGKLSFTSESHDTPTYLKYIGWIGDQYIDRG